MSDTLTVRDLMGMLQRHDPDNEATIAVRYYNFDSQRVETMPIMGISVERWNDGIDRLTFHCIEPD